MVGYGPNQLRLTAEQSNELVNSVRQTRGTHNNRRKRVERLVGEALYAQYTRGVERARLHTANVNDENFDDFLQIIANDARRCRGA